MVNGLAAENEDVLTNNQNLNIYRRLSIFASNGYEDQSCHSGQNHYDKNGENISNLDEKGSVGS